MALLVWLACGEARARLGYVKQCWRWYTVVTRFYDGNLNLSPLCDCYRKSCPVRPPRLPSCVTTPRHLSAWISSLVSPPGVKFRQKKHPPGKTKQISDGSWHTIDLTRLPFPLRGVRSDGRIQHHFLGYQCMRAFILPSQPLLLERLFVDLVNLYDVYVRVLKKTFGSPGV